MPKNIVLLSDGTGNSAAKLFKTNVWRLHGALDLHDPTQQVAHYSDGVGTSSFKPFAILGGVFGFGLKRNVLDLYHFACRSYQPGDRIWGFGFSRGAFTIRIVAGLIARQGLVPYHGDEAHLTRDALAAYRAYRARFDVTLPQVKLLRLARDWAARAWRRLWKIPEFDPTRQVPVETIHFLGVWDTVAAYGGPIEEITRGIDYWLWPLSMPDRYMSAKITRACHALALDDERNAFWPVLWDEHRVSGPDGLRPMMADWKAPADRNLPLSPIDRQRLSQVWFTGMHSDVGGGYAQDGLSYLTLDWMMDRAVVYGLLLDVTERNRLNAMADGLDKLNDSRHGLAGYYRYKPRKLADVYRLDPVKPTIRRDLGRIARSVPGLTRRMAPEPPALVVDPVIHESVFQRITAGVAGYAPIVLPATYRVTTGAGEIRPGLFEHPSQATNRAHLQEGVWNCAWVRRVVYFATVFASLFVAALPLIEKQWPGPGRTSRAAVLISVIEAAASFVPSMAAPWLEAFKAAPGLFAIGAGLVTVLLLGGGTLQGRIRDRMLGIWRPIAAGPPHVVHPAPPPRDALFRLRTATLYRGFFYALTHWILPTLFALAIACGTLAGANRLLFAGADSLGLICRGAQRGEWFDTTSLCHATDHPVTAGKTYRITLETDGSWWDGYGYSRHRPIETGPAGFGLGQMAWQMTGGLPLRRHLGENWFAVILRVGENGRDEQALRFDESPTCAGPGATRCTATFQARSDGRVLLFVNDAVIALPRLAGFFYGNNKGRARVRIEP